MQTMGYSRSGVIIISKTRGGFAMLHSKCCKLDRNGMTTHFLDPSQDPGRAGIGSTCDFKVNKALFSLRQKYRKVRLKFSNL